MKFGRAHTMLGRVGAPSDKSNVAFGVGAGDSSRLRGLGPLRDAARDCAGYFIINHLRLRNDEQCEASGSDKA